MRVSVRKADIELVVCMVAYVGLSAVRDVWLHLSISLSTLGDWILLLFAPVCLVTSIIWLIKGGRWSPIPTSSANCLLDIGLLNIATAMTYTLICVSLALVFAHTANAIGIALVPLFATVLKKELRKKALACSILILGCVLLSWEETRAPFIANGPLAVVGIGVAAAAGLCTAWIIVLSRRLNRAGMTAEGVFAVRFWLIFSIALVWSAASHVKGAGTIPAPMWQILLGGFLGIVVPLYAFQRVIAATNTFLSAFAVPLIPVVVFLIEVVGTAGSSGFPVVAGIGVVLTSVGVFLGMRH